MATTALTIEKSVAKSWLRVTHTADDALIEDLVKAALDYVAKQLGATAWSALQTGGKLPELLRVACLELVSHWYTNRDAVVLGSSSSAAQEVPLGVERCLRCYQQVAL